MKLIKKSSAWSIFFAFFIASPVLADTAVRNIQTSISANQLNLKFHLADTFNPKMEEAIQNGIPTTFTYYVQLYQSRSFWNDRLLKSVTLKKTIKYDNLKEEFTISADNGRENGDPNSVLPTFKEAKVLLNQVEINSFYPMWRLERNNTYYLKIKAEAKGVKPPPYIHYILFFLEWKYFETDWVIERFRY